MQAALDRWFIDEILVHEDALVRYLQRCWSRRDEIHDLRQEVYARVYEAAAKALPTQPKSFLFASARHLMTDRLRRSRVLPFRSPSTANGWPPSGRPANRATATPLPCTACST